MRTQTITSLADLKPWKRNPRAISEKALAGLQTSIAEYGDLSSIVFNIRNQSLVTGHQRLKAIDKKFNGQTKIEKNIIMLPTGERFPIRFVDWSETKHAAANVVANSQFVAGEYTEDLVPMLDELSLELPDLSQALNFDDLRIEIGGERESEIVEDEVPEVPILGSGTTLIAAEKLERRCYGMEIEPKYCDVIVTRYCNLVGSNKVIRNGKEIDWKI